MYANVYGLYKKGSKKLKSVNKFKINKFLMKNNIINSYSLILLKSVFIFGFRIWLSYIPLITRFKLNIKLTSLHM